MRTRATKRRPAGDPAQTETNGARAGVPTLGGGREWTIGVHAPLRATRGRGRADQETPGREKREAPSALEVASSPPRVAHAAVGAPRRSRGETSTELGVLGERFSVSGVVSGAPGKAFAVPGAWPGALGKARAVPGVPPGEPWERPLAPGVASGKPSERSLAPGAASEALGERTSVPGVMAEVLERALAAVVVPPRVLGKAFAAR